MGIHFTGGTQHIDIGNASNINAQPVKGFGFWYLPDTAPPGADISFAGKFDAGNGWSAFCTPSGVLGLYQGLASGAGSIEANSDAAVITSAIWRYIVLGVDVAGNAMVMYVGTESLDMVAVPFTLVDNDSGSVFGDDGGLMNLGGIFLFNVSCEGTMARVCLANTLPSLAQAKAMRKASAAQLSSAIPNVVYAGEWATATDIADLSGAGNDGANDFAATTGASPTFPLPGSPWAAYAQQAG